MVTRYRQFAHTRSDEQSDIVPMTRYPLHAPIRPNINGGPGRKVVQLLESLPFVRPKNSKNSYVHRPRSMAIRWFQPNEHDIARIKELGIRQSTIDKWIKEERRLSAQYWCGAQTPKAEQLATPGLSPLCATCEGRAVAIGLPPANQITTSANHIATYKPNSDWAT